MEKAEYDKGVEDRHVLRDRLITLSLIFGSLAMASASLLFGFFPARWTATLLQVPPDYAVDLLLKRYAASASAAILALTLCALWHIPFKRSLLLGFSIWFIAQAFAAGWGLIAYEAGGFAWLAVLADPLLSLWFFTMFIWSGRDAMPQHRPAVSGHNQRQG